MSRSAFLKRRVAQIEHDGETYHVRPLTGLQLEEFIAKDGEESLDGINALSRVCCYCACDADGARIWSDDDLETIRADADFSAVKAVADKALAMSGLGESLGND